MMVVLEASWWYVIICVIVAAIITAVLYYKSREDLSKRLVVLLSMLRFTAVLLIALLLLSPIIKSTKERIEMPLIVVATDNSGSMLLHKDSVLMNDLKTDIDKLCKELKDVATVERYSFGNEVKQSDVVNFKDKKSNYSDLISVVKNDYYNRNISSLIVIGDGIMNDGMDPIYVSDNLPFAVHTVAVGDTTQNRDIRVSRVANNDITYMGNKFPIEVVIEANLLKDRKAEIKIANNGKTVATSNVDINSNSYHNIQNFYIDADKSGMQKYTITVSTFDGEKNIDNNSRTIYIKVLEDKQDIAIIASVAHPDIGAIKRSLSSNMNYNVDVFVGNKNVDVSKYDAVVLHQIPDKRGAFAELLKKIENGNIPMLVIVGSNTSLIDLNKMNIGVNIVSKGTINDALPMFNSQFSAFKVNEEIQKLFSNFPPLKSPLGTYTIDKKASIEIFQRIGNYTTDMPLVMFYEGAESRYGLIAGENIWRWRLFCYDKEGNFDAFDEVMSKMMQYLVTVNDKRKFKVTTEDNISGDEEVVLFGELYNDNYEAINDVDVEVLITNDKNEEYKYTMNPTSNDNYTLNIGRLAEGIYKYNASCSMGGNKYVYDGEFMVNNVDLENINNVANHRLLSRLSSKYNGVMVYPDNMDYLIKVIKEQNDLKPVSYTNISYEYMVDKWWVLMLIVILLSGEWFLRKWSGRV